MFHKKMILVILYFAVFLSKKMDRTEKAFSLFIDTKYEKASAPLLCCSGGSNMLTGFFTTKNKKIPVQ